MAQRTTAEWVELLGEMGLPCGPVQDLADVAQDPQVRDRGMVHELQHPTLGPIKSAGNPIKLSRTPGVLERAAPDLGQDTAGVLSELLGLSGDEIAELKAEGVVE